MDPAGPAPPRRLAHWAWFTAVAYAVTLFSLTLPTLLWAFPDEVRSQLKEVAPVLAEGGYWLFLAGLALVQAAFLFLVPVPIARARPVTRRRWWLLAGVAGLLMAVLFTGLLFAVNETAGGGHNDLPLPDWAWVAGGIAWIPWTVVFVLYRRDRSDASALRRILDHMMCGSVVELLVAVPCHVVVRSRPYCCAGFGTFLGLATGLAVLMFSFGPAVFFLFAERARRLAAADPAPAAADAGRHARDAEAWTGISFACLVGASAWAVMTGGLGPSQYLSCQIAALVTGGAAVVHAAIEWRRTGALARPLLVVGLLAAEAVVLFGWAALGG